MALHNDILNFVFGADAQNEEAGLFLVRIGWIYTFVICLLHLRGMAAPYGKHLNANTPGATIWNCFKVSSRLGWMIQECPSFIVPAIFLYQAMPFVNNTQIALMVMFMSHYFNRSFIFPFQINQGKDTSIWIVGSAFLFCLFNGFIQSHFILYVVPFSEEEHGKPTFVLGLVIFILGMAINLDSDQRLRKLRSSIADSNSKSRYKIPYGGAFDYVSSANYFGEIVEWWGFALSARFTPASLFFAGFTTMFLGLRGIQNHRWYLEKFGGTYPPKRRAIFPFFI